MRNMYGKKPFLLTVPQILTKPTMAINKKSRMAARPTACGQTLPLLYNSIQTHNNFGMWAGS